MSYAGPRMIGLYLFVSDMKASIKFYRALGLEVEPVSLIFARATWSGEVVLELGAAELTQSYDPSWQPPGELSKCTVNFQLESRDAVDSKYASLVASGYIGQLAPCDPLWQARFAIVKDPDGNFIGLHSPRDRGADKQREQGAA